MKAANVFYDPQENSYFKVDKQTGQSLRVHKNGSDIVHFKPEYSGSDYKIRKSIQKQLSPPCLKRPKFQVKLEHKHTISSHPKSYAKSLATLAPMDSKPMGFGRESQILETINRNSQDFNVKLKEFSILKQRLKNQNHSPRHGVEGSILQQQSLKGTINMLQKNLKSGVCNKKRDKQIKSTSTLTAVEMPQSLVLKNQLKRQRQIFLKYNQQFINKNNERQQNEMRDRKTNLKILQKLQLQKNEKQTNQVYDWNN